MSQHNYGLKENAIISNKMAWIYAYLAFLCINFLIAISVATQSIAHAYSYQEGLGSYLFIALNKAWYAPYMVFIWASLPSISKEIVNNAENLAQISFITPQIIVLAIILYRLPKGNKKLHGSAHFAKEQDIKDMSYLRGTGVYVGGWSKKQKQILYLRHNGPEHVMCFAPTRSGKGVGLILPTLLSWEGSSIVLDIKGENWALTAGWRRSQGQTVLRFDPSDASGSACKFNPLEEIRLDTLYAIQDVQNTAMMIVDPEGKGLSDHWTKAAFAFFSGIILYSLVTIKANQGRSATLLDLTIMMSDKSRTIEELLGDMLEDHCDLVAKFAPNAPSNVSEAITIFINSSAAEMSSKAENEASGVISSALINMALYRDPIININTENSDFRINDLMNSENPVNLYLVLSPDNIDRVRPLIRLITDLIIRRICKSMAFKDGASVASYKHRLLLMFDEFTSLGKLPIIEKGIAYLAGYGGKLYLIVQDITQLNGVYGKDNALMANCHVRIAYAPNTTETAKILSEMTGKTTVVDKKISFSDSKGGRSKSTSISETARPLLTPDECMRLPAAIKNAKGLVLEPGHMLIFTAGQSPIYGCQILYFKDPIFSKRAKIEAPGISESYPNGITDSLYYPRPKEWYNDNKIDKNDNNSIKSVQNKLEISENVVIEEKNFNDFFKGNKE